MMVGNDSLANFYKVNFNLMQHHKWSLTEVDNLIPWERDVFIMLLIRHLEEERERLKDLKKKTK